MRFSRIGLLIFLLLLSVSVWAQQPTSLQQATAPTAAPQDPYAISIVHQVLAGAGGISAIRAIQDYTGSGNITYPSEQDAQGTVTVLGLAGTEFRMDANLPAGTRSWAVADGIVATKMETGAIHSTALTAPVPSSDAYPFQTPLFPGSIALPVRQLAAIVGNPNYAITYKGVVDADGHSTHEIELQRSLSGVPSGRSRDIFIDAATFQIVKVADTLPKGEPHVFHYSDYRAVAGVLMPFSITEEVAGQQIWTIQLNQFNFNTGLQATSFAIQ
jgi:hypothetical protein